MDQYRRDPYTSPVMPGLLLHWRHDEVAYAIRHVMYGRGWLFAFGPGTSVRRGRVILPTEVVQAWRSMDDKQRAAQAEAMLREA